MTRNSYKNTKLYRLSSSRTPDVCVLATYMKNSKTALNVYKSYHKKYRAGFSVYYDCFKLLDFGDMKATLIEKYPCKNRKEAFARKHYWEDRLKGITKRKSRVNCECGGKYLKGYKTQHERSKKHQDYLNPVEISDKESDAIEERHRDDANPIEINAEEIEDDVIYFQCECGGFYEHGKKELHYQSELHNKVEVMCLF